MLSLTLWQIFLIQNLLPSVLNIQCLVVEHPRPVSVPALLAFAAILFAELLPMP